MTETVESGSTNEVPFLGSSNSSVVTSGDLQNIQPAFRLNGKNYLKWSELIKTFLKGKGKLNHVLGTGPKESDPTFAF